MACEKCRLKRYCCCYPLRNGAFSIAIFCIVFAAIDLIFTGLEFGLSERQRRVYIILSYITIAMDILIIIVSIMLLIGAMKNMIHLVWPWLICAFPYLIWRLLGLGIRIYLAVAVTKKKTSTRESVAIVFDIIFCVYFFYCVIVIISYVKQLRYNPEEARQDEGGGEEEEEEKRKEKERKKKEKEEQEKREKEKREKEKREKEKREKEKERRGTATSARGPRSVDRGSRVSERRGTPSRDGQGSNIWRDASGSRAASSASQGRPQRSIADNRTSKRSLR